MSAQPRSLSIVLHTHMPYVEGFGTWPFGEEWLWEAMATSYLPLAAVVGEVELMRRRADLAQERQQPLARSRRLELVAQHRRERDGDRGARLL